MEFTSTPNLASKLPQIEHRFVKFTLSCTSAKPRNRNYPPFLTYCSTNPNTNKKSTDETHLSNPDSKRIQFPSSAHDTSSLLRGLVFDSGPDNSWDSLEVGSPVVKRFIGDEEERWCMWYHGRSSQNPNSGSIGLAVSGNGIHWERGAQPVRSNSDVGLVLGSSQDWWAFDTHGVRPAEILLMSSNKLRANGAVYWLFYTGFSSEKIESFNSINNDNDNVYRSLPGLAMSQDGRHWARIEGEHHSGSLLDVGPVGSWDASFVASPHVVHHGPSDLRMYYHSWDARNRCFKVGLARSRDGIRWVRVGPVLGPGPYGSFDRLGPVNAHISRNKKDGTYVMVYEGLGENGRMGIGMAVSADGVVGWRRVGGGPVIGLSEGGGWDSEGVGSPCLVEGEGEEWRLYYRGIGRGGKSGIGLAVAKGKGEFERWKGFGF